MSSEELSAPGRRSPANSIALICRKNHTTSVQEKEGQGRQPRKAQPRKAVEQSRRGCDRNKTLIGGDGVRPEPFVEPTANDSCDGLRAAGVFFCSKAAGNRMRKLFRGWTEASPTHR